MSILRLEKVFYWIVRVGAYILPFTLLIVAYGMFFPFVSGKGFALRIIIEIMAAAWVSLLIIDFRKYWPRWSLISTTLVAFVAVIFLASFLGVDFKNSFWSNFERMEGLVTYLHLLGLFFVLTGVFRTRKEWFTFFGVSIFVSVLVAFYGLLEATGEVSSLADSSRIISTLGNPLYVAAYLSFNIFLAAFLWMETKSSVARWFLGGVIIFESIIFFMTGARGAFLGILSGLGFIALLSLITADSLKKKIIFGGIIGVVLLIPLTLHIFKDSLLIKKSDQLSRFANITLQSGEARFTIWKMALESVKERPILGWGAGNFIIPFAKYYDPQMFNQEPWFDRTHNTPLEWLVAGGILGFLAYLSIFGSIILALIRSVRQKIIENKSSFIFFGMIVSYLVQMIFVFDTQATYLMLITILGFLHIISSNNNSENWLRRNTMVLSSNDYIKSENTDVSGRQLRNMRREQERRLNKSANHLALSGFKISAIAGVFGASFFLVSTINIRPIMSNMALIDALSLFNGQYFVEANEAFKKALKLSHGTIGTEEAREHAVFKVYDLLQNPEILKKPGAEDLYHLAANELEKQIKGESKEYLKIKHNILLAQLYHQRSLLIQDPEILTKSFEQYKRVLQFAPNYISVYPIVANLYGQTGNMNEAIRLIEKATDLLSGVGKYDAQIFYSKALFYTAARRYDEAYGVLEKISAEYSSGGGLDAEMMENIILATRSYGADAIPFLEKISSLDRKYTSTFLMLAQLNAASGNMDKASFYANEALKIDPSIKGKIQEFLKAIDR